MILLYPLLLLGAGAVIVRRRLRAEGRGWAWFAAWLGAGALFTFSFLTGFSIGLFLLPLVAVLFLYVAWRAPHLPEALGFVAGIGTTLLVGAFLHRNYKPCPEGDLYIPATAPPGTSVGCGGVDPAPWFRSGTAVVAAALLAYGGAWMWRRSGRAP